MFRPGDKVEQTGGHIANRGKVGVIVRVRPGPEPLGPELVVRFPDGSERLLAPKNVRWLEPSN